MALDSKPARLLTDRECTKILGGVVGALMTMATPETVVIALNWWVEHPEALPLLAKMTESVRAACTEG